MPLPTLNQVRHIAFTPERYGKQPACANTSHAVLLGDTRGAVVEDNDDENGQEVYGCSKLSQRSAPERLDGSLEKITSLPIDALYEIFGHLHPKDVLNLSRSTKGLRTLLTDGHARGVWRTSLASVRALPACPSDMTEIQYANLAFDDRCHFCLAPGVKEIAWACRVRCCPTCLQQKFISEDELDLWLPENIYIEKPEAIFPFLLPAQKRTSGRNKPMYFLPPAREYLRQLDTLADDAALAAWSADKREKQALRMKHAAQCEYWYTHWAPRSPPAHTMDSVRELTFIFALSALLALLWRNELVASAAHF
ncbi:hypothetical protein HYPSUDRAFT_1105175 [Hypholoma sublateritium FD-334 SS-4]|uniref:F-box domain-containing protein n=1 Tax=Hypholoma sublateritium (strain FD-334 SS-4) TaxID=945553 RepID=A0A0D2KQG4_HYPSF|nr:hypothetical protein HYPSUDRAFT_1105175 [Hypholoma sublateritium FD-334 SS-4]